MSHTIERFEGDHITDSLIAVAAEFFTLNYGIWGPLAANNMGVKEGARVKMSPKKLKEKILPSDAVNIYVRMLGNDGNLIGNVFATRWTHSSRQMLWITQLCVSKQHRNQGIATKLLTELRDEGVYVVGILSSHPFAIAAALRVFGSGLEKTDLEAIRQQAPAVMKSCPVEYVRSARLRGSLFESDTSVEGAVSCADTTFWIDHQEPLEALELVKAKRLVWPFGDLPEGHEFFVLVVR